MSEFAVTEDHLLLAARQHLRARRWREADTLATLARAVQAAAPALAQPLARNGLVASASTPQELAQVQKSETAFWSQLVASSGFKPED